jgi:hypothetical protein
MRERCRMHDDGICFAQQKPGIMWATGGEIYERMGLDGLEVTNGVFESP